MATITSAQAGNTSDGATWVGGVKPGASDIADIDHDVNVDENTEWQSYELQDGVTFTVNAGITLTLNTADPGSGGSSTEIILEAGASIINTAANKNCIPWGGSKLLVNGTSDSQCSLLTSVGRTGIAIFRTTADSLVKWCNIRGRFYKASGRFENCAWDNNGQANLWHYRDVRLRFINLFWYNFTPYPRIEMSAAYQHFENLVIGYKRDGTSATVGYWPHPDEEFRWHIHNAILNVTSIKTALHVENLGYVDSSMLPGTGSALDLAAVDAGINKSYLPSGTIERSTSAKKTGDYGARLTPDSVCETVLPLEASISVPIQTGDDISVSVYGRRHTMTDDCAEVEIDPEGAWFTPNTSAPTLTNDDTWYEFTPSASGAGGTAAKGSVRIVLRLKEYQAGAYFDWADGKKDGVDKPYMVIIVTHSDTTTSEYHVGFETWSMGMPSVGLADPPADYPAEDDVENGVDFDYANKTGTLVVPGVSDVECGVGYGASGTEHTGTLVQPAVADVESGVQYGGGGTENTGTLVQPAVGDVEEGVQYGGAGTENTGTFAVPAQSNVLVGTGYGSSGTEFTGTLVPHVTITVDGKVIITR